MTREELNKNLNKIKESLDTEIPAGDIDGIEGKMLSLCSLMGLSAECYKQAQYLVLMEQGKAIKRIKRYEPNIQPSTLKLQLEAELAEEKMTFDYADRLNSAITHCVDGLRTSISKYKEELSNSILQK
jgi:hypothetical protein